MSSLQQTPENGQQVPPSSLIDGVSQQQIDEAVKEHVRGKKAGKAVDSSASRAKAMRDAQTEHSVVRKDIVIDAALGYLENWFGCLESALVKDCEESDSYIASPTLDVVSFMREEVQRIRSKSFTEDDEFWKEFRHISGLCHCLPRAYDTKDTTAANILENFPDRVEILSGLIEWELTA